MQANISKEVNLINTLSSTPNFSSHTNTTGYAPPPLKSLIADSGATSTYLPSSFAPLLRLNHPNDHIPISIKQPNGSILQSSASGILPIPNISDVEAHIFDDLTVGLAGLPQLCDLGCTIILDRRSLTVLDDSGNHLLTNPRTNSLWTIPLTLPSPTSPTPATAAEFRPLQQNYAYASSNTLSAYNVYPVPRNKDAQCLFWQQCFASATKNALLKASTNGLFKSVFPQLTPEFIRLHYVDSTATATGYLQRSRQRRSSKKRPQHPPTEPQLQRPATLLTNTLLSPSPTQGQTTNTQHLLRLHLLTPNDAAIEYSDIMYPFPTTNIYYLILYAYDPNYIQIIPLVGAPTTSTLITAYLKAWATLQQNSTFNYKPTLEITDNIVHEQLHAHFTKHGIAVQLVPPNNHRSNNSERAIQTVKKMVVAGLKTCHPNFPISALPHLMNHFSLLLNLLRKSRINDSISAYEQVHGPFSNTRWPLIPVGARGLVYEPPEKRALGAYGAHGVEGFYVGIAPHHYGCYTMFIPTTNTTRITDSVYWLPFNPNYPKFEPNPINPYAVIEPAPIPLVSSAPPLQLPLQIPISEGENPLPTTPSDSSHNQTPSTEGENPGPTIQMHLSENYSSGFTTPINPITATSGSPPQRLSSLPFSSIPSSNITLRPPPGLQKPGKDAYLAHAYYTHYYQTLKNDRLNWEPSMDREIEKLYKEFNGISIIDRSKVPTNKLSCPYLNPVTRIKRDPLTNQITDYRTRLTWGVQPPSEDPSANASSVIASPAIKLFLNSVVSDKFAQLHTIDLNYFYYQSRIPTDYCRLLVRYIPPASRKLLGIQHLHDNDTVYIATTIAIPGRPDAGKIAQDSLIQHLQQHGYIQTKTTPALFRHVSNSITFCTHVDDFIIKSDIRSNDIQHLSDTLAIKYQHKINTPAKTFLGATIRLDRNKDHWKSELGISMPNFVRTSLAELNFIPTYNPSSPAIYVPPSYSAADMLEQSDDSAPATIDDQTLLRKAVGKFRYYAPAIDICLITPVSMLANQQSNPTANTMDALSRFLNYAYHHPSAELIFRPSNMVMYIHSDASHHSEPNSRSRAGGFFVLGEPSFTGPDEPYNVNAPFDVISTKLPTVTGSTAESETGAMYINASAACAHRQTLIDLGFPQPPTPIVYDNQVAGKVLQHVAKQKKSKAFATRYNWLKDRLRIGDFRLVWAPGAHNLADYFTKSHPSHRVRAMRPIYVHDISQPISQFSNRKPKSN